MGEIADYKIKDVSFEQLRFFRRGSYVYAMASRGNHPHSGVEVRRKFETGDVVKKNNNLIDKNARFPDPDQFPNEGKRLKAGKQLAELEGQFDGGYVHYPGSYVIRRD